MSEIKPAFSGKYLLLLIVTAVITAVFTFVPQYYLDKETSAKIVFSTKGGTNELNQDQLDKSIVSVKYSLKDDTSEVAGYYHKYISIENVGSEGIENLKCQIAAKDTNIVFLNNPRLELVNNEQSATKIEFSVIKISSFQHIIQIPLLNKNEAMTFVYNAYSKKNIPELNVDVIIRKKDLEVEEIKNAFAEKESYSLVNTLLSTTSSIGIYGVLIVTSVFILSFIRYFFVWFTNSRIREKYNGNFWQYWYNN